MRTNCQAILITVLALAGCGDDAATQPDAAETIDAPAVTIDAPTGGPFTATGTVVATGGATVPATGHVMAMWTVSSGSPDYIYKFGDGTATGATHTLSFPSLPPTAALNLGATG